MSPPVYYSPLFPTLRFVGPRILFTTLPSLSPLCVSQSHVFGLLVGFAACHRILSCSCHGTLLVTPPARYPLPLPLCSLSSPALFFPLIICYATLALQGSTRWSPFLCPPVLICYATAIPSYTSHWSLSAELSITLSLSLSSLFTPSPCCLIPCFCCQRFVSSYSMQLRCFSSAAPLSAKEQKGCAASRNCV